MSEGKEKVDEEKTSVEWDRREAEHGKAGKLSPVNLTDNSLFFLLLTYQHL